MPYAWPLFAEILLNFLSLYLSLAQYDSFCPLLPPLATLSPSVDIFRDATTHTQPRKKTQNIIAAAHAHFSRLLTSP